MRKEPFNRIGVKRAFSPFIIGMVYYFMLIRLILRHISFKPICNDLRASC